MFKWVEGRQNSGYFKMLLFRSKLLKMDMYLLKFQEGVEVPWHKDPAKTGRHFRFNLYLTRPGGGELLIEKNKKAIFSNRLCHLFRADDIQHAMTKVEGGTLYLLSIGKVLR